uniref:Helitron helicase-like domain-containing protein n=1 Tax=Lactuca sativa TaxID=4236 RepID=A0A9R1WP85_LACSA|nr:hypothetical protein LSAT_V11C100044710 [Lactuca sativa]
MNTRPGHLDLWVLQQQLVLRCESYENLRNQKAQGNTNISNVSQCVILHSSFTGGARYMLQNYLDAIPKEESHFRHSSNRQLDYVFFIIHEIVFTIEFQERGLPHSHICLFMHSEYKLPTVEFIDPMIFAEIPDRDEDPELYSLVNEFMIHGPCGAENINCPCMVEKKCSKNIPKQFCNHTFVDQNGFPLYRRRNDGHFVEISGVQLENRNVVPYNKYLLKRYQVHINVEWCNLGSFIKYLFKYINKGPDRAIVVVEQSNNDCDNNDTVNEINEYYDCRYLSHHDEFLNIMLIKGILLWLDFLFIFVVNNKLYMGKTMILTMFSTNLMLFLQCSQLGWSLMQLMVMHGNLRMLNFLQSLFWQRGDRIWKPREVGKCIGRIHSGSLFLKDLLSKVKGSKSFEEIHTVNGEEYSSFRDACYALGL